MKSITIKKNDANKRLDKFLTGAFKKLPVSLMYKYIRTKRIKLNGKRCHISDRLKENDIVTLYISDDFLESSENRYDFLLANSELDIIYEDDNIMILNKPQGLIVHSDQNNPYDSLISRILKYLYNKGFYNPEVESSFTPALVNRIDRNTSGIVICAKNSESLQILNERIKNRELQKYYFALAHGIFSKKEALLTAYLERDMNEKKVYIYNKPNKNTKTIKTKYKVISEKNNISFLEIHLLTGRTHQIRAHMAYIGHPLVGDGKYGKAKKNEKQILCAYKVMFDFKSPTGLLDYLSKKSFEVNSLPTKFSIFIN